MLGVKTRLERIANRAIITSALAQANLTDAWQTLKGSNSPEHRLGDPVWEKDTADPAETADLSNLCIFVIYASQPSLSTLSYLQSLKDAGFEIVAINNTTTSEEFLSKLKGICLRVYNRQNIGRDIGAFKDGIMTLYAEGLLQRCKFLCLANDSMQFIPGRNGQSFTAHIAKFIKEDSGALFTHQSHQISKHYQSYFQILDRDIINSKAFYTFWRNYRPLSHREHCIHKGELELSSKVYNHLSKTTILYTSAALLEALNDEKVGDKITADSILGIMPSIARTKQGKNYSYALEQLTYAAKLNKPLDQLCEHYLAEIIEYSNPSHVAAFLYPLYLSCPLIKHDICFAGSFSVGKALLLFDKVLCTAGIEPGERVARNQEFFTLINTKGIPMDYRNNPIQRALKGVTNGFEYYTG
jgi:hypothetical protein